jgi:aspartate racemase
MFQLNHLSIEPIIRGGLRIEEFAFDTRAAKFDLSLEMIQQPKGLKARLAYNTDLFDGETITRMLGHYQVLLKAIVSNPQQRLSALPLLTEAERRQLLVEWNNTATEYPHEQTIHRLFEEQARERPDKIAVISQNEGLTYAQLNARANKIAHMLRAQGVEHQAHVGVCVERSPEMLTAFLGILKAGCAYVPLDPSYPAERLSFLLEDADISVVLTEGQFQQYVSGLRNITTIAIDTEWEVFERYSEENPNGQATGDDLAYIMYTSGSTGTPKGVLITHRGVVRLVRNTNYAELNANQVFLQLAPFSFDASTFEIWGCLLNGAQLVLMPPGHASLEEIGDALRRRRVTTLWLTAGLFHQMADRQIDSLRGLRQLLVGGDVVSATHARRVLADFAEGRLINGYGPTEATTFTCCYLMSAEDPIGQTIPIGRPVSNTQVYILDKQLQAVPIGVAGELLIGGDGLARGYLNEPDLTLEKFIPNPFTEDAESLLYKTGDLARYRVDGNIEFLGRLDRQVKIRGFRVEPAEIEAVLAEHPNVGEALVVAEEDTTGGQKLIAYVVANRHDPAQVNELRSLTEQKLPTHMVPSSFVLMDKLPLTAHGKIERSALPAAQRATAAPNSRPRTPIEKQLAQIWSGLLNVSEPGVQDDFFHLGGHSLLATQLMSRVQDAFGLKLPLRYLFENPTIAFLAERIAAEQTAETHDSPYQLSPESMLIPIQSNGHKLPFYIVPGGGGGEEELIGYAGILRSLGADQPCYGFNARALMGRSSGRTSVEELAYHLAGEIEILQPKGPCLLGGECIGGIVAFEAARQLQARGRRIGLLALLDTQCPNRTASLRYRLAAVNQGVLGRMILYQQDLSRLKVSEWGTYMLNKSRKAWKRAMTRRRSDNEASAANLSTNVDDRAGSVAYALALLSYKPRPYEGSLTLLISEDLYREGRVHSWTDFATQGTEVYAVPGNHTTYIREQAQVLAQYLRACLNKAQG